MGWPPQSTAHDITTPLSSRAKDTILTLELEEIDAALKRLYHSPQDFGRDERTGHDIPFERLDVIPWARTGIAGNDAAAP
jgi:RNA polymerase-binding transcription factor DksA